MSEFPTMVRIESVLIEHLPRLQCCNVFVQYHQADCDSANSEDDSDELIEPPRFGLNHAHIILDSHRIELPAELHLETETLSRFQHKPGHISFRLCTGRPEEFAEELLPRGGRRESVESTKESGEERTGLPAPVPSIERHQSVQLRCVECKEPISEYVQFERVLPLPSDNMDASEWFCNCSSGHGGHGDKTTADRQNDEAGCSEHTHDADTGGQPSAFVRASNASQISDSRQLDLLYGQYFCVLHRVLLNEDVSVRNDRFLHCACGQMLGEYFARNRTAKLWNDVVCYTPRSLAGATLVGRWEKRDPQQPIVHIFPGHSFDHFVTILRKAIQDFDFLMSSVAMPQTIRCLFTSCAVDDDIDDDVKRSVLFVQVMNPALAVWSYNAEDDIDFSDGPYDPTQTVPLLPHTYIKIMYCVVELGAGEPAPPLVASWHSDATVHSVELCDRMMQRAVQRIVQNATLLPECFREQMTGGFRMSYLW